MPSKHHVACVLSDNCGSSDGLSIYDNETNYQLECFACGAKKTIFKNKMTEEDKELLTEAEVIEDEPSEPVKESKRSTLKYMHEWSKSSEDDYHDRGILKSTYRRYLVKGTAKRLFFPYFDKDKQLSAFKIRDDNKNFHMDGLNSDNTLFGQTMFPKGQNHVFLFEGEYDAMAAYEMLGSKYACLSIPNGANSALASCKKQFEYLDSFQNIYICFDNDEQGRRSTDQVANLFAGKSKVIELIHKDANEYLKKGDVEKFTKLAWSAKTFTPDGIVAGNTLWEKLNKPKPPADVMYPWDGLNDLTYGIRAPSIVTITAGSGLGKSFAMREIVHHTLKSTEDNIGLMFLEESIEDTGRALMSVDASIPFHLPDSEYTQDDLKKAYENTLGTGRVFLFDHFGSTSVENILSRVKFLAKALNCKYIFLDHVSIVVSAFGAGGDERKAIDEIMTKLAQIVQECKIVLFLVSHLKRPEGKGHEEGSAVSLGQLRGSGSIGQLSWTVLGLERNGQHEDPKERNTTTLRVLKNRFCGLTGPACRLYFDRKTGRMIETVPEDMEPL